MNRIAYTYLLIITAASLTGCSSAGKNQSSPQAQGKTAGADIVIPASYIYLDTIKLAVLNPSGGVRFFNDSLLFLSPSKNENRMLRDQISFGNVEAYYRSATDTVARNKIFSRSTIFTYPAEALTFSPDFSTLYFTRLNEKDNKEKIYSAAFNRKEEGWTEDQEPLWFCQQGIRYSHPALSRDGKLMVFASDMAGGSGKMDLFFSRLDNGKWTLPENLGKKINSPGDELYPFIGADNKLYFSSNGLKGYGGYDIFACLYKGQKWDIPVNISSEVNTKKDEIAFTMNGSNESMAVFSSSEGAQKNKIVLLKITKGSKPLADSVVTLSQTLYALGRADKNFKYESEPVAAAEKQETKPVPAPPPAPEKKVEQKPAPVVPSPEKPAAPPAAAQKKDVVVYRVQIASNLKPKGIQTLEVNGVKYKTFEYLYLKEYRTTIGEFSEVSGAVRLRNELRNSGMKDAFVVAFKNNVRSNDASLFK